MISPAMASRAARAQNRPKAPAQREAVLAFILSRGLHGATSDEAEVELGLPHQSCSARFKELKDAKRIFTLGEVRRTRSAALAIVYVSV